jgi:hypothetical protein
LDRQRRIEPVATRPRFAPGGPVGVGGLGLGLSATPAAHGNQGSSAALDAFAPAGPGPILTGADYVGTALVGRGPAKPAPQAATGAAKAERRTTPPRTVPFPEARFRAWHQERPDTVISSSHHKRGLGEAWTR